jgi:hypothetical protein
MMFSKWMTFLTSLICAIYGMSPDEINFESFAASRSSLSGADTAEKLADSKDKGLRPLMSHLESVFSDFIVAEFGEKFCFRWTGLDEEDQDKRHELRKLVLTVNEVRAQEGYEAMKGPLGDAPLNPSLTGVWMQQMQAQQPEDFGTPDDQGSMPQNTSESDEAGQGQDQGARDGAQGREGDFGRREDREGDFGKAFPIIYSLE